MLAEQFVVNFDPHANGITDAIRLLLLPGAASGELLEERIEHLGVTAMLYNIQVRTVLSSIIDLAPLTCRSFRQSPTLAQPLSWTYHTSPGPLARWSSVSRILTKVTKSLTNPKYGSLIDHGRQRGSQ